MVCLLASTILKPPSRASTVHGGGKRLIGRDFHPIVSGMPRPCPLLRLSLSLQSHAERVLCQGEKHAMGFSLTRPDWSQFSGRCRNVRNLFLAVCSSNEATRRLAARLALVFQSAMSLLNPLAAVRPEKHAVR